VKLATFVNPYTGEERMGILLADGEDPLILDANALAEKRPTGQRSRSHH
jgi:hypothetical protein